MSVSVAANPAKHMAEVSTPGHATSATRIMSVAIYPHDLSGVARVTGCEITAELMRMAPGAVGHRFFFVVDGAETESAVKARATRHGVVIEATIPPFGFERDARPSHANLAGLKS